MLSLRKLLSGVLGRGGSTFFFQGPKCPPSVAATTTITHKMSMEPIFNFLGEFQKRAEYGFGEYGFKHRTQRVFRGSLSSGERTQ